MKSGMHRPAALILCLFAAACAGENRLDRQVFESINTERERAVLRALVWDEALAAEARAHAFNMAGRRFFSHVDPVRGGLAARLAERGIRWRVCAENIFNEKGHRDPAREAVRGWLASPGHRENIFGARFTHTGVGTAVSADGVRHFVQIFLTPR